MKHILEKTYEEQSALLQERQVAVAARQDADEKGISLLIGGLMVFGLALGGLAIGYVSSTVEIVSTSVLTIFGSVLTGSGIWSFIRR